MNHRMIGMGAAAALLCGLLGYWAGRRSFFLDARGRVRYTGEDRAATSADAPR